MTKVANQKRAGEEEAMNNRPNFCDCIIFAQHLENITVNKVNPALHREGSKQPHQGKIQVVLKKCCNFEPP